MFSTAIDFSQWQNGDWLFAGLGLFLLLLIILTLIFTLKKDKKTDKPVAMKNEASMFVKESERTEAPKTEEPKVENKPEEPKMEPEVEKETETKEPTQDAKKAPAKKAKDVTPKAVEPKEDSTEEKKRTAPAKYHISQNKDTDAEHASKWRVRKEGSSKTIKYFKTQKEAIAYAEKLAENQDSSIVIHKKDGSIRKQDYTKK